MRSFELMASVWSICKTDVNVCRPRRALRTKTIMGGAHSHLPRLLSVTAPRENQPVATAPGTDIISRYPYANPDLPIGHCVGQRLR